MQMRSHMNTTKLKWSLSSAVAMVQHQRISPAQADGELIHWH